MNLTKNVNISGVAYIIDEDAFNVLGSYLQDISSRIKKDDDRSEIIHDIEERISEILQTKHFDDGRIVSLNEIKSIISTIGSPELFGEEPEDAKTTEEEIPTADIKMKLMRDMSDKKIGGVCSGIAAFAALDTTIIRLAFFLMMLFYGCGLMLYIISWIVIPAAESKEDVELLKKMKNR